MRQITEKKQKNVTKKAIIKRRQKIPKKKSIKKIGQKNLIKKVHQKYLKKGHKSMIKFTTTKKLTKSEKKRPPKIS